MLKMLNFRVGRLYQRNSEKQERKKSLPTVEFGSFSIAHIEQTSDEKI